MAFVDHGPPPTTSSCPTFRYMSVTRKQTGQRKMMEHVELNDILTEMI